MIQIFNRFLTIYLKYLYKRNNIKSSIKIYFLVCLSELKYILNRNNRLSERDNFCHVFFIFFEQSSIAFTFWLKKSRWSDTRFPGYLVLHTFKLFWNRVNWYHHDIIILYFIDTKNMFLKYTSQCSARVSHFMIFVCHAFRIWFETVYQYAQNFCFQIWFWKIRINDERYPILITY